MGPTMSSTYMPPRSEVENDRCRSEWEQQVELGGEDNDPDTLESPLKCPVRVPGPRRGRPQPTIGQLRRVDLESAHLHLRTRHVLVNHHRKIACESKQKCLVKKREQTEMESFIQQGELNLIAVREANLKMGNSEFNFATSRMY
jgi:hypothetical protein